MHGMEHIKLRIRLDIYETQVNLIVTFKTVLKDSTNTLTLGRKIPF